jgi:hypothetical protein
VTPIAVSCARAGDGWICTVRVSDDHGTSEHDVGVGGDDLDRLAPGAEDPADLVRRSFEFLLEREPRTSILPRFELPVIARYFPEYEATVRQD